VGVPDGGTGGWKGTRGVVPSTEKRGGKEGGQNDGNKENSVDYEGRARLKGE